MRATALKLAYGALALTDTALAGSGSPRAHRLRRITKPLLMPVLAAAFRTDPRWPGSPLRASTLAAQGLSWGGDVALLRPGLPAFASGIAAFGAGQVAYTRGLRGLGASEPLRRNRIARAAGCLFAVTGPPMAFGAARQHPVLAPAVLGYAGLLTTMAAAAAHLRPDLPDGARWASAAGAGAFLASDSILGARQFLLTDPPAWLESAVMGTYTAAQYLLAEGALRSAASAPVSQGAVARAPSLAA